MTHSLRHAAGLLMLLIAGVAPAAEVPATVTWAQRVELGTLVSGVVDEVAVRPGQLVKKGDKLLSLDRRGFATEVSRYRAAYRHAKSALDEAALEDERAAELYDRTVLSDFERNQAKVALQAATASAERARAALVGARLDLERSEIRAPFDGTVLAVNVAPGQTVVTQLQSQSLVTLADTHNLRVRALVDPTVADSLKPGQSVKASLRDARFDATIAYVGFEPAEHGGEGLRYALVADLATDASRPLRVGETVTLHLD